MLPYPPALGQFVRAFFVFAVMLATSFCDGGDPSPTPTPSPSPTASPTPSVTPVANCGTALPAPNTGLPVVDLTVTGNGKSEAVKAEVASTTAQRARGLMSRPSMPDNEGMLFVFQGPSNGGFWMRNTLIPLAIAYLDADGTILVIKEGVPCDDKNILTPGVPYRYVLEMNHEWYKRKGFGVGSKVNLPPNLPGTAP